MTASITSQADKDRICEAIGALIDIILDGRMDELDEKEHEAIRKADEAMASLANFSEMTRAKKYDLAATIISEISEEWDLADDSRVWQAANVEDYESSMSFDELAAEVRAITFR